MEFRLLLGITLGVMLGWMLLRGFLARNASTSAYRAEINDILRNKKYQVKGKFD